MNIEYITKKAYGINWLKNKHLKQGGAQKLVIDSKPKGHIVVSALTHHYGALYADVSPEEMLNLIKHDIYLKEVITEYPAKVWFDLDIIPNDTNKDNKFLNGILNKINSIFPNGDMAVSGSVNDVKISYHIISNTYILKDNKDLELIRNIVQYLNNTVDDGFDITVYKTNQAMKTIYQSKPVTKESPVKRIQNIIINNDDKKHIITAFFNDNCISISDLNFNDELLTTLNKIEHNKPLDITTLPKMNIKLNNIIDVKTISPLELLQMAPINGLFHHRYTFTIMLFCFTNGLTFDNYIEWYKNKNSSNSKINEKYKAWNNMYQFKPFTIEAMINLLSTFYPKLKTNYKALKFDELININDYTNNVKIIKTISQNEFIDTSFKYNIFFIGMGGGKTEQTIIYMRNNPQLKYLFITPNQALGFSVYKRMTDANINIEHYDIEYSTKKTKTNKHKCEMNKANNLICCINSLHYIDYNKYDVVIIDEAETVFTKWFDNKTLNGTFDRSTYSWTVFLRLLDDAKRVIMLDAFTTKKTIEFVKSMPNDNTFIIYKKCEELSERVFEILPTKNMAIDGIIKKLKTNNKVFIYYPFLTGNKHNISMKELNEVITKATGKTGKIYNSEIDDALILELKDVNKYWADIDFIITNSKITVGVNFDIKNVFDSCFLFLAGFSSPRDVIQASCRARHIISDKVYVNFIDKYNTNCNFSPGSYLFNDPRKLNNTGNTCLIYSKMTDNIIIEKVAPIMDTFFSLCKIAGYKIVIKPKILNDELELDINELLNDNMLTCGYTTIKDITNDEADILIEKVTTHNATTIDKLELKKYFYKRTFVTNMTLGKDESDILIGEAFDDKFTFFFEKLTELKSLDDTHIINEITKFNNWSSIIPNNEELTNMKLNDELVERIFTTENWFFSRLNKKSAHKIIIRNIYNTFFNRTIINSTPDKNKHTIYKISDKTRKNFNFGIVNLISHRYSTNKISNINIFDDEDDTNIIDKINSDDDKFIFNTIDSVNVIFEQNKIIKPEFVKYCFKCNVILDYGYLTYTDEFTENGDVTCCGTCSKAINKQIEDKNNSIFKINFFDE